MPQLCNGFPVDAANFYLSYAQSVSFVRYIHQTYGAAKLETLIGQYADGIACEIAPQAIYGSNLTQLDRSWRDQEFGYNTKIEVAKPIFPWLAVLAVASLAPFILMVLLALRFNPQKK